MHAAGNYISLTLRLKPASESGTAASPHPACSKSEFSSGFTWRSSLSKEAFDYPSILNGVLPSDIRIFGACNGGWQLLISTHDELSPPASPNLKSHTLSFRVCGFIPKLQILVLAPMIPRFSFSTSRRIKRILAAAPAPSGFDARFSCLFRAYQRSGQHWPGVQIGIGAGGCSRRVSCEFECTASLEECQVTGACEVLLDRVSLA